MVVGGHTITRRQFRSVTSASRAMASSRVLSPSCGKRMMRSLGTPLDQVVFHYIRRCLRWGASVDRSHDTGANFCLYSSEARVARSAKKLSSPSTRSASRLLQRVSTTQVRRPAEAAGGEQRKARNKKWSRNRRLIKLPRIPPCCELLSGRGNDGS